MTKHQRYLVLLAVLVVILVSAPITIVIMKLSSFDHSSESAQSALSDDPAGSVIKSIDAQVKNLQQAESTSGSKSDSKVTSTNVGDQHKNNELHQHAGYDRGFVAGNWVVVDCERRIVLQCPHQLIDKGTSPRFAENGSTKVLKGHCRDVSIKVDSFCKI